MSLELIGELVGIFIFAGFVCYALVAPVEFGWSDGSGSSSGDDGMDGSDGGGGD